MKEEITNFPSGVESAYKYEPFVIIKDKKNSEISLGKISLKIDTKMVKSILSQRENMPKGCPWVAAMSVINHTTSKAAKQYSDFSLAKNGDYQRAVRIVNKLVKPEKILKIANIYPHAHIVYIHRENDENQNMIPLAYAKKFEELGMRLEHDIVATTSVHHTNSSDIERLLKRMRYKGEVCQGRDYILVDDFITSGSELRDLRDYIESKGGNVVKVTTFGLGSYGKLSNIAITEEQKEKIYSLGISDKDLRKYGIAYSVNCLTCGEAAKLLRIIKKQEQPSLIEKRVAERAVERERKSVEKENVSESQNKASQTKISEDIKADVCGKNRNHRKKL